MILPLYILHATKLQVAPFVALLSIAQHRCNWAVTKSVILASLVGPLN